MANIVAHGSDERIDVGEDEVACEGGGLRWRDGQATTVLEIDGHVKLEFRSTEAARRYLDLALALLTACERARVVLSEDD